MHTTVKIYGKVLEVTQYEKISQHKVRVSSSSRGDVYGARRIDSLRRTKQICMRRLSTAIEELGCPLLVTCTLEEHASDAGYASNALRLFFRHLRVVYPSAQALFVPEVSPRGRIHFHGLLFGVSQSVGDIKKGRRTVQVGSERRDRLLAKSWGEGFVDCRQTDGSPKLAYYLSKYILKHGDDDFSVLLNGLRLVRCTVGFPREMVFRDNEYFNDVVLPRYSDVSPLNVWESRTRFTGLISKKKYKL